MSRLFHFDFTTSFLIFTAIVNIHHFILDGKVWKLRDSRVASMLVDRSGKSERSEGGGASLTRPINAGAGPLGRRIRPLVAFRVPVLMLLFLCGGMDQVHFALGTEDGNLSALLRAARWNPYDSSLQARIALAEGKEGRRREEVEALTRAVAISPHNAALQHACGRAMIEDGLYAEAYDHYAKMLRIFPRDPDALVNYGLLAVRLGYPDVAIGSWEKAEQVDPNQPNPHLYLAEALDQKGNVLGAARHWKAFLQFAAAHPNDPAAGARQRISAAIQLADDESRISDAGAAASSYQTAIALAQRAGAAELESLALAHLADLQEKIGDAKSAANSYRRALALDEKAADPGSEALDWFNYGQFLRRHGLPEELAYACFLRAEGLMAGGSDDHESVKSIRRHVQNRLGKKAAAVRANLPSMLARATQLPKDSF